MSHSGGVSLASLVIDWQRSCGRRHLPWQDEREPYRVWLSEIMLQQTQVSTVLDYYPRFLQRFPNVAVLAAAPIDDVLAMWSGLGYYSRARNLHACAQQVVQLHQGAFPTTAAKLEALPGIGRSTAAAIAAFCYGERVSILDANVKRVLSRVLGFAQDLAVLRNERALWELATELLPTAGLTTNMPSYTQGLMDLGATVCHVRTPRCSDCPLRGYCVAYREGEPQRYPVRNRKLKRTAESWWLLLAQDSHRRIWLQRRASHGIWAGLHCLPSFTSRDALLSVLPGQDEAALQVLPVFLHVLTHKDLHLHPLRLQAQEGAQWSPERETGDGKWFSAEQWRSLGLPAPVRKLLEAQHGGTDAAN